GPRMLDPEGGRQPSRRGLPAGRGTLVRRTPLRRVVRQRHHYPLDEPEPTGPVQCDWMLGGFLLLRRSMLEELGGFDEGFRLYGEDIDPQCRAMAARRERRYAPPPVLPPSHPPLPHPPP